MVGLWNGVMLRYVEFFRALRSRCFCDVWGCCYIGYAGGCCCEMGEGCCYGIGNVVVVVMSLWRIVVMGWL